MSDSLTCIHRQSGLCPSCQAEHDYDPASWQEYGRHAEGERRWRELQAEMAAEAEAAQSPAPPDVWDGIPF